MRRMIEFPCAGDQLVGTLDQGNAATGLLIVSGGNEIRSGAHAGQAILAAGLADAGYPVFRYDRRGIGDSEGDNRGFDNSAEDIAAALAAFRSAAPGVTRVFAFGNCDAASALALFKGNLAIDALILANPWVIEPAGAIVADNVPTVQSAQAIRARYWARLKNPRSIIDLFTGKINLGKLVHGLSKAASQEPLSGLGKRIGDSLAAMTIPTRILIAERDTTAMAFMGAWQSSAFKSARERPTLTLSGTNTASHSFADPAAKAWLTNQILACLK